VIRDNLAQKLKGTKAFKLNIFQEIFGFFKRFLKASFYPLFYKIKKK